MAERDITLEQPLVGADALGRLARAAFSFRALLGFCLAAATFVIVPACFNDPDMWWHLRVGGDVLATGSWPKADPYSITVHGAPWIAAEWLGDVLIALAAQLGNLRGVLLLQGVLSASLLLLLYYYATLRSGNFKSAFVACGLLLPMLSPFLAMRPQLLGYNLLLVTLTCLERFRQGHDKALWLLPPVFLVWGNTHGTFAFGLLAMAVYWASGLFSFQWGGLRAEPWSMPQRKQLLVTILFCLLLLNVTPYGSELAAYPMTMAAKVPLGVANVTEWQAMGTSAPLLTLFLAGLLLFLVALVATRPSYRVEDLALLLFAIYTASVHARFTIVFVIIFAPFLAGLLGRWVTTYNSVRDRHLVNAVLMVVFGIAVVLYLPSERELTQRTANDFPQAAVQYLREHPAPESMLNLYSWGGYLMWSMPEHQVFIDGRTDVYEPVGVFADYLSIERLAPDALPLLQKYGVRSCLIPRESALATLLSAAPGWDRAYEDKLSILFVRR